MREYPCSKLRVLQHQPRQRRPRGWWHGPALILGTLTAAWLIAFVARHWR